MGINFEINNNGSISRIYNTSNEFVGFDSIYVITDKSVFNVFDLPCKIINGKYIYTGKDAIFTLEYESVPNSNFLKRNLSLRFLCDTVLLKIQSAMPETNECFLYNTFYNASAAVFARNGDTGICSGFENPYFYIEDNYICFEPSLILKAEEEYFCDANFFGVYRLYGEKISPKLYKTQMKINGRYMPRYRNPSEGTPLYFSEIKEFNRYTANYFECDKKSFKFMTYDFFGNMVMRPDDEKTVNAYLEHIDAVKDLGCDTILLNPLCKNRVPNEDKNSFWELFPNSSNAEKIYKYAKDKGLKVGSYTGTAGNGKFGNSSMIGFCENSQYKKVDIKGNLCEENCIADDSFVEWYLQVIKNTVKEYGLSVWNWDPGPGNGFYCYAENHGHIKGKGAYKGFRNTLKIMQSLKEEFPDLYFQGFHGNKEYGLWGYKYIDQHEAYWENENYVMNPLFDDISADRVTADNIRLQSTWNYYFRFMPQTLNHGISHRMVQCHWMNNINLDYVLDYCGYKYALLSSIAAGGSVTPTIIPRKPKELTEYFEFYKKWIGFAKDNFYLSNYTLPFGNQCGCGIEGYSKIKDNKGYIFLFNPDCKDCGFEFELNERLGFYNSDTVHIGQIYPYTTESKCICKAQPYYVTVPAYGCLVLKADSIPFGENEKLQPPLPRVLQAKDTFSFFADNKIKQLLDNAKNYMYKTGQEALNEWSKTGKINTAWGKPDRVFAVFMPDYNLKPEIEINGKNVPVAVEEYNFIYSEKGVAFADITDFINFGEQNTVKVYGNKDSVVYLHYPKSDNEQIVETDYTGKARGSYAPILDKSIMITYAKLNEDNIVIPCKENTITVKVNVPDSELEGVYASFISSISGIADTALKMDIPLDCKGGVYTKTFNVGDRLGLIIDDNKISVWAVTKDNTESETYKIPINWIL